MTKMPRLFAARIFSRKETKMADKRKGSGEMTVREAGHLGGEKGGQKVRELIKKGEEMEKQKGWK